MTKLLFTKDIDNMLTRKECMPGNEDNIIVSPRVYAKYREAMRNDNG